MADTTLPDKAHAINKALGFVDLLVGTHAIGVTREGETVEIENSPDVAIYFLGLFGEHAPRPTRGNLRKGNLECYAKFFHELAATLFERGSLPNE